MAVRQAALVSDESALEACLRRCAIQIDDLYLFYVGPVPRIESKAVSAILNSIRRGTGSQWRTSRIAVSDVVVLASTGNELTMTAPT